MEALFIFVLNHAEMNFSELEFCPIGFHPVGVPKIQCIYSCIEAHYNGGILVISSSIARLLPRYAASKILG